MNLGLIEVDSNDSITLANHSFSEISGYNLTELIGQKASDLFLSKEGKQLIETKNELRTHGVTDSYEVQIKNKKGENRHWLVSGAPNYDINGKAIGSIGIHLDITEQKEQEERLYLLSLIAEKNINAVIISDVEGRIEWVNSSFEKMSGYTKEELVGIKPGYLLQGKETNPETITYLKNQISNGHPFNCEIINYSKTGEKYWVKIQGQALYNKKGEIVRYFAIEENISNKKILENQREELVASLAKTNKELEDYAQIVSHDLKSPLRSIHSLISWIKEDSDKAFSDQTLSYFSMIENKVEKMDHLIEGILTYSKIDKEDVVKESVNTHQIVQNIIDIIHIPEHVTISIKNQLPILRADRYRIQQLFQNIIGNAVNYIETKTGLVEISSEEFDDYYVFSIKDNGVGIAKEHYKKIFNTFQSYTKSEHSTGLGLAIVKKVVDAYNGEIWIDSELGKGSTFFVKLNK
jgi:PAS domain S-box-containing protein